MKSIDVVRQKLCGTRSDKKAQKLTARLKKTAKEIKNKYEETLATTNGIIYAGAYVITGKLNGKPKNYNNRRKRKQPLWKTKIEKEINKIRGEIAILDQLLRPVKVKLKKLCYKKVCYEETEKYVVEKPPTN